MIELEVNVIDRCLACHMCVHTGRRRFAECRFQMLHRVLVARGRIRYELHVGGVDDCDATPALLLDAFDKVRAPVTDYDARRAGRVDNRAREQDPLDMAASRTLILALATSDPRAILSSSSFNLYEASPHTRL